jgi:hypothetical protein
MTQYFHLLTVAGQAADWLQEQFHPNRPPFPGSEVDRIATLLLDNRNDPSIVHATSWIDKWSMLPLASEVLWHSGSRFQLTCLSPGTAAECSRRIRLNSDEDRWFARRLNEASTTYLRFAERPQMILIREVLGVSIDDDEYRTAWATLPAWLAPPLAP